MAAVPCSVITVGPLPELPCRRNAADPVAEFQPNPIAPDAEALLQSFSLLRRAATQPTITYRQLVDGAQINGALPALTG
jgi:hypothetical protein